MISIEISLLSIQLNLCSADYDYCIVPILWLINDGYTHHLAYHKVIICIGFGDQLWPVWGFWLDDPPIAAIGSWGKIIMKRGWNVFRQFGSLNKYIYIYIYVCVCVRVISKYVILHVCRWFSCTSWESPSTMQEYNRSFWEHHGVPNELCIVLLDGRRFLFVSSHDRESIIWRSYVM